MEGGRKGKPRSLISKQTVSRGEDRQDTGASPSSAWRKPLTYRKEAKVARKSNFQRESDGFILVEKPGFDTISLFPPLHDNSSRTFLLLPELEEGGSCVDVCAERVLRTYATDIFCPH